jgi:hypothetical protein
MKKANILVLYFIVGFNFKKLFWVAERKKKIYNIISYF